MLAPDVSLNYSQAGMLSRDGRCKMFDSRANGYVRGEGVGTLVVVREDSVDHERASVLAMVRASGVNQDGASNGLTAPSSAAQSRLLRGVIGGVVDISAADVSYVECHGTGTGLGDPIEFKSF